VCGQEKEDVRTYWTTIEPVFFCYDCFQHALESALRRPKTKKPKHIDIQEEENPLREL